MLLDPADQALVDEVRRSQVAASRVRWGQVVVHAVLFACSVATTVCLMSAMPQDSADPFDRAWLLGLRFGIGFGLAVTATAQGIATAIFERWRPSRMDRVERLLLRLADERAGRA